MRVLDLYGEIKQEGVPLAQQKAIGTALRGRSRRAAYRKISITGVKSTPSFQIS
ncbi:MAG: hypothetical protein WKG07_38190 [Hymenobacter sp.]